MKPPIKIAFIAVTISILAPAVFAQLAIPTDGSDGALNVTSNTVIDLSQAVTGVWSNNNSSFAGKGIYDPNKWAVVFKYSSVNIAANATVTFTNHPSHAPVVWLVSGDVTINGTLSVNGHSYISDIVNVPEPGPGGFRGGFAQYNPYGLAQGSGFGPGGPSPNDHGYYLTWPYGNARIVPLIGGSGGSGNGNDGTTGSAGGGAILIAAANNITVNGLCSADGGSGSYWGSGGAVRLVANQILGNGKVSATSVRPGRIRFEANSLSPSLVSDPATVAGSPTPVVIWPDTNAPTVKVVSVAGIAAPADPKASLTPPSDDITVENTNVVTVVLQTSNFPTNGTVSVYFKPRSGGQSILNANYISGDTNLATWQVSTVLKPNYTVIQARATSN